MAKFLGLKRKILHIGFLVSKKSKDSLKLSRRILWEFFCRNRFKKRRKKFSSFLKSVHFLIVSSWTRLRFKNRIHVVFSKVKVFLYSSNSEEKLAIAPEVLIVILEWITNKLLPLIRKLVEMTRNVRPEVMIATEMVDRSGESLIETMKRGFHYYTDIEGYGVSRPLELMKLFFLLAISYNLLRWYRFRHLLAYERDTKGNLLYRKNLKGKIRKDSSGLEIFDFSKKAWVPNPSVMYEHKLLFLITLLFSTISLNAFTQAKAFEFLRDLTSEADMWLPALLLGNRNQAVQRKLLELGIQDILLKANPLTLKKFICHRPGKGNLLPKSIPKDNLPPVGEDTLFLPGPKAKDFLELNQTLFVKGNQTVSPKGLSRVRGAIISLAGRLLKWRS